MDVAPRRMCLCHHTVKISAIYVPKVKSVNDFWQEVCSNWLRANAGLGFRALPASRHPRATRSERGAYVECFGSHLLDKHERRGLRPAHRRRCHRHGPSQNAAAMWFHGAGSVGANLGGSRAWQTIYENHVRPRSSVGGSALIRGYRDAGARERARLDKSETWRRAWPGSV